MIDGYYSIAIGGIALIGIGYKLYIDAQKKKAIKEFGIWVENYVKPQAEEIRNLNNKLSDEIKEFSNKLENKLK